MSFNKKILIENLEISKKKLVVIAEAGVNHFGDFLKMKKLIDLAAKAKADIFKTQFYKTDELISKVDKKWHKRMLIKEVNLNFIKKSQKYAKKKGLVFMCTPHDDVALSLMDELNLSAYKIGSGEKGNFNFLSKIISKKKPIIISTGLHKIDEIERLVFFLKKKKARNVVLLHCITSYPTPLNEVDINNIVYLAKKFKILVGYSDHTNSFLPSYLAVSRGACVVEKHITLDYNIRDAQDWKVSAGPDNFEEFVKNLKMIKPILGEEKKKIKNCEKASMSWALKRLVAAKNLNKNMILKIEDLKFKRINSGIEVQNFKKIIGKRIKKNIKQDHPIFIKDLY
tara:strand:+ start:2592 stop:3611 length:1020 start_codon:yes stop_codon:yes gene_type:complete